jgi:FkbM family methyltransferase
MWDIDYLHNLTRAVGLRRRLRFYSPMSEDLQKEIVSAYRRLGRPISSGPINLLGYKISFLGEHQFRHLFDEIFVQGSYFFKCDTTSPLIFDCGSNIGMSVLFFKKLYPNSRIVAFEPDPTTFETLRKNVDQNGLVGVELHQVAVTDRIGTIELFRDVLPESSSLLMSTVRERHSGPSVVVPARRLSDFISSEIDLLKIDVEGAEDTVITDLVNAGKLRRAKRIHLEYHHHIDTSVDRLSSMLRLIEENDFGYQLRVNKGFWPFPQWPSEASFEDVSIYCYRK